MADAPRVATLVAASMRRAMAESTSELTPLMMQLFSFGLGLLSQAFLGGLVDAGYNAALGAYEGHYATFLLLGMALLDLQNATVGGLSHTLRSAQVHGSLESMLATPTSPGRLLFALAVPDVVLALARMVIYGLAGVLLFRMRLGDVSFAGVAVVLCASLVSFAALALVGAALTLLLRRADPLALLLAAASVIAGGVFYPRGILPRWLAFAGDVLPIAPALDALRAAVVYGAGPLEPSVLHPLFRLCVFVAVVGPLGFWLFGRLLARARHEGSLTAF